jgi:hypothetical protein
MATSPLTTASAWRPATRPTTEFVVRVALAAAAVVLCYQFRWDLLRFVVSELNLRLDALMGVTLQRMSADTVMWHGQLYRYVIACTFADVWCGAIPLIWDLRRLGGPPKQVLLGWGHNFARILVFGVVLIAFDAFRLSVSDVLFAAGVPWDLAHGIVGGLAYFAVWVWIWNHRSWRAFNSEPEAGAVPEQHYQ